MEIENDALWKIYQRSTNNKQSPDNDSTLVELTNPSQSSTRYEWKAEYAIKNGPNGECTHTVEHSPN